METCGCFRLGLGGDDVEDGCWFEFDADDDEEDDVVSDPSSISIALFCLFVRDEILRAYIYFNFTEDYSNTCNFNNPPIWRCHGSMMWNKSLNLIR